MPMMYGEELSVRCPIVTLNVKWKEKKKVYIFKKFCKENLKSVACFMYGSQPF